MTTKLLDTNVCIAAIRGHPNVVARMEAELPGGELRVSVVTVFELVYGAKKSGRADEMTKVNRFIDGGPTTVEIDRADATMAGRLRAELAARGTMIGAYDLLIAGQARARRWGVVTANTGEFARVDGLALEDWTLNFSPR